MFDAPFLAVLEKEGVVPIVTWNDAEPHVAATWNSYVHRTDNDTLLIPVLGMKTTQDNLAANNRVKMIFGSKDVMGKFGSGAGFLVEGTAAIIRTGEALTMMQQRFSWANCVMEVTITKLTQTV